MFGQLIHQEARRRQALVKGIVTSQPVRCVQCGICSYSCPIGIDVRRHVREGSPVTASQCLTCGQCVARCPRGVLTLEPSPIFS